MTRKASEKLLYCIIAMLKVFIDLYNDHSISFSTFYSNIKIKLDFLKAQMTLVNSLHMVEIAQSTICQCEEILDSNSHIISQMDELEKTVHI